MERGLFTPDGGFLPFLHAVGIRGRGIGAVFKVLLPYMPMDR